MDAYIFICLGTRDIQFKKEFLNQIENEENFKLKNELKDEINYPLEKERFDRLNVRKFGHWLSDNFETIKEYIQLPIIGPSILFLIKQNFTIKKIYLIATDQSKSKNIKPGQDYLKRDTCLFAQFLKGKYLPYFYETNHLPLPDIEIILLNEQANIYDSMIKELDKHIKDKYKENGITDNKNYKVFAEITGGTPQINLSTILNCLKYYQDKVAFIYKPEGQNEVKELQIGNYIFTSYKHESLIALANRYDFDAIANNDFYPDPIKKIAESACARLNFDFYNFQDKLKEFRAQLVLECEDETLKKNLEYLNTHAKNLLEKEINTIFNELYWNAYIMWVRDEVANFIARIWRMTEAIQQNVLYEYVGYSWYDNFDESKPKFQNKFKEKAKSDKNLIKFINDNLPQYGLNQKVTSANINPTRPILEATIDYRSEKNHNLKVVAKHLKKLKEFGNFRNSTIIAHGFQPVSKDKVISTLNGQDVFSVVKELIESAKLEISQENPFDIFKQIIIDLNEKNLEKLFGV